MISILGLETAIISPKIHEKNNWAIAQSLTSQSPSNLQLAFTLKPLPEPELCGSLNIQDGLVSPDSQIFAVMTYGFVERNCGFTPSQLSLWNLKTGEKIKILMAGNAGEALSFGSADAEPNDPYAMAGDFAHDLALTPDGKMWVGALSAKVIQFWDSKTGEPLKTLSGHEAAVRSLAITPDGQTLISGSSDKTLKFWDLKTGRVTRTLTESLGITRLILSPDGQTLVSVARESGSGGFIQIKLWEVKTGKLIRDFSTVSEFGIPEFFSSDSRVLISRGSDNGIKLWDARKGIRILTLKGHLQPIRSLAITGEGQFLASSSTDRTVKLWNLKSRKLIRTIEIGSDVYPGFLTFSPDGKTLAISDGTEVEFWNWRLPEKMRSIPGSGFVQFTPDGTTIILQNQMNLQLWR